VGGKNISIGVVQGRDLLRVIQINIGSIQQRVVKNGVRSYESAGIRSHRIDKIVNIKTIYIGICISRKSIIPVVLSFKHQLVTKFYNNEVVI